MTYSTLLLDLDNTLLSFDAAEKYALNKLFEANNLSWKQEIFEKYDVKNKELWRGLEQGIYEKEYVLSERFVYLFKHYGLNVDGQEMDQLFRSHLADEVFFMPDAVAVLDELKEKQIAMHLVTNGVGVTQKSRLKKANLATYFSHLFISEEVGYQKPAREFFSHVLDVIPEKEKGKILMVGDSLSADITGGNRAGLDTCWYSEASLAKDATATPTYHIKQLTDILTIV